MQFDISHTISISILTAKRDTRHSDWRCMNYCDPFTRIIYVEAGSGVLQERVSASPHSMPHMKTYRMEPGCIYIIPAYVLTSFWTDNEIRLQYIHCKISVLSGISIFHFLRMKYHAYIGFSSDIVKAVNRIIAWGESGGNPAVGEDSAAEKISGQEVSGQGKGDSGKPGWGKFFTSPGVYADVLYLLDYVMKEDLRPETSEQKKTSEQDEEEDEKQDEEAFVTPFFDYAIPSWLETVFSYIENNLSNSLRVEQIAAYVGFNRSHLSRMFSQYYGISLSEFIQRKKIEKAIETLYKGFSQQETAYSLGFSDVYYFSKQFKKIVGVSPGQYLKGLR